MWRKYYRTCLLRIWHETWRWGKGQVLVILLAIATLAWQLRAGLLRRTDWRPSVIATIGPYVAYGIIFLLYQFLRVPALLYCERDTLATTAENALRNEVAEREKRIHLLTPKRPPAEQRDCEKVKQALVVLKRTGLIALRHIRDHRSLTIGAPGSPYAPAFLPAGLSQQEALFVYRHCANEGILKRDTNLGNTLETFTVPDHMSKILDEVLFATESTSAG